MSDLLKRLFGLKTPVDRRTYFVTGASLMTLKYVVDAVAIKVFAGVSWTPWDYLTPARLLGTGGSKLDAFPRALEFALLLWTLLFVWIGVSMTLRRAIDAGKSPWLCLAFFVPLVNYAVMLFLAIVPTAPRTEPRLESVEPESYHVMRSAIIGIAVAVVLALGLIVISVFGFSSYNGPLFLGVPVVFGAILGYVFNRHGARRPAATNQVVLVGLLILAGSLVVFALEGVVCVAMAFPIAFPLAALGGQIGRMIASMHRGRLGGAMAALLFVPSGLVVDRISPPIAPTYEITTAIDIAAPPATVWRNVIGFREIHSPLSWYFRAGLAYPIRASIAGEGVGSTRRCVFSTGAFIEPITVWDPPRALAFGVTEQPAPLQEWSPYSKVYAPHLKGLFVSERGEFRLIPLASGGTRLEGHTWYHNSMAPQAYWRMFSDPILHRIHMRVLEQVKLQAEDGRASSAR